MSEFDKLKDDAEQYAQQHPEQVKEGEQAVEKKLGVEGQDGGQPGQDGGQPGQAGQGTSGGGETDQSSGQGQAGQGQ
jgi:hypothetical protein